MKKKQTLVVVILQIFLTVLLLANLFTIMIIIGKANQPFYLLSSLALYFVCIVLTVLPLLANTKKIIKMQTSDDIDSDIILAIVVKTIRFACIFLSIILFWILFALFSHGAELNIHENNLIMISSIFIAIFSVILFFIEIILLLKR